MKYVRRYLQEVEVIERTETVVRYLNEFNAECIMTVKQFDEFFTMKRVLSQALFFAYNIFIK